MNSEIDILEVMSSKFNENSPENTVDDLAISEDKTLKWRRLKNNKFASARRKSVSGEGGVKEDKDGAVTEKDKPIECVSDNDKNNRVLRRNKPSSVISVARKSLTEKKDKTIRTRGSFIGRGRRSLPITQHSDQLDVTTEIVDGVDGKSEQENGEKSETKLRRSERTQFNSPSKSDDVITEVKIEKSSERDVITEVLSSGETISDSVEAESSDIDVKASLIETSNEAMTAKNKSEPPKRGRKKLTPSNDAEIQQIEAKASEPSSPREIKQEDIKDEPLAVTGTVDTEQPTENDGVKIPKKRGRKPGTKLKSKFGPDNKGRNLPVKKSSRITKDGNDSILATAIARKEKCNEQPLPPQRLSRRIKPTPKILANEELRYGFEVQNNARLSISSENLDKDYADLSPPKSEIRRSRSIEDKKPSSQPIENPTYDSFESKTETNGKQVAGNQQHARPCPDPVDFINEIKLAKINLNRSPEDNKKLNVKQKRRLIKLKEKLFSKLGLQRTNQANDSSDGSSDSDADEFVPAKKIQVSARTGVTLRLRRPTPDTKLEKKLTSTEATATKWDVVDDTNGYDKTDDTSSRALKRKCENSLISSTKHKRHSDASRPIDAYPDESRYGKSKVLDTNICLCNKSNNYYTRKTLDTSHCRAIDEIDDEHIGCSNEVDGEILKLYRPSVRALYMILCNDHKKRLIAHNSCAGCGIFCTQGRFVLCSKNHFFHRDCAIKYILNTPFDPQNNKLTCPTLLLKCPHCGDAPMHETLITMKCKNVPLYLPKQKMFNELSAKMSIGSHTSKSAPMPTTFDIDLASTIPVSINNLLNKMKIKLNYSKSSSFTTKDFLYAVHGKDVAQLAEIIGRSIKLQLFSPCTKVPFP